MSLVVAAIAAAGVGLAAGAVAVGTWLRRRARRAADEPPALPPAAAPVVDDAGLSLMLGDMVQVEQDTRWLRSGLRVHDGGRIRCALWYTADDDDEQLVVAFAEPDRHIYWLERVELTVPDQPPSRLEIEGRLLDRVATFPAAFEPTRRDLDSGHGTVSFYEGAVGDAAVALHAAEAPRVYAGPKFGPDEYERLGTVDPDDPHGTGSTVAPADGTA